jgi:hypothetical protein
MNNPFEAVSARQTTAYTKARLRTAEKRAAKAPMKLTEQEQKQKDDARQVRLYRRWKRGQIREFRQRNPQVFRDLRRLLRKTTLYNSELLLRFSRYHLRQLKSHADRSIALNMIGWAIARLRIRNGYPPFDDSLPGEDPTVFEIIRAELDCFSMPKDNSWA